MFGFRACGSGRDSHPSSVPTVGSGRGRNPGHRHLAPPAKASETRSLCCCCCCRCRGCESWSAGHCARSFCHSTRCSLRLLGLGRPGHRGSEAGRRPQLLGFSVCVPLRPGVQLGEAAQTSARMSRTPFRVPATGPLAATHQAEPCKTGWRVPCLYQRPRRPQRNPR